jgi:hypothetical protein
MEMAVLVTPSESRESLARPGDPNGLPLSARIARGRPYIRNTRSKGAARVALFGGTERVTGQNEASDMIHDRQRVTVAVIAETKLSFVVDRHQIIFRGCSSRSYAQGMGGWVPATTSVNQIRAQKNVAGGARCRPGDIGMELGQSGDDFSGTHVGETLPKRHNPRDEIRTRSLRWALRCAGAVDEALRAIDIVPRQPLVQGSPTHTVSNSQFADREETSQIVDDESCAFHHWPGLFPRH